MKDLVISARAMWRELAAAGICFLLAVAINAGAIVAYRTHWIELLTTFHLTLLLALLLYVVSGVLRLLWAGVRRLVATGARHMELPDRPSGSTERPDQGASAQVALASDSTPERTHEAGIDVPAG